MNTLFKILMSIIGGVIVVGPILLYFYLRGSSIHPIQTPLTKEELLMQLSTSAFRHQNYIPSRYTCDGENINPSLSIQDAPEDAKSLVLIMDDPDAPGGTFVHWTIWNIDPGTTTISENSVPGKAIEGMTSFGKRGYGGPCPPSGTHRYFFKLYALDIDLVLDPSSTAEDLESAIQGHILAKAELMGLYTP